MNAYQKVINIKFDQEDIHLPLDPDLLFLFISPSFENAELLVSFLKNKYPKAKFAGCSTSGEIHDIYVSDHTAVLTALQFDKTTLESHEVLIEDMADSQEIGVLLAKQFDQDNLKHVLVFSDGLNVNGANLVAGLTSVMKDVSITGGLAGDGANFNKTFVISNTGLSAKKVVAIGFYGDHIKVGYGSKGGWDSFGIERLVSKSKDNILYELDGQPALEVYKSFLGEASKDLPGSGLLFPLSLRTKENLDPVVRTILAVNEDDQSLTFAGNIPEGSYVRMMKANINRLIDGAEESAKVSQLKNANNQTSLSLLISCVGRRLVLKQLVEEEIEAVKDVMGEDAILAGFYSYGEIGPFGEFSPCHLHNQTMTITTISE